MMYHQHVTKGQLGLTVSSVCGQEPSPVLLCWANGQRHSPHKASLRRQTEGAHLYLPTCLHHCLSLSIP